MTEVAQVVVTDELTTQELRVLVLIADGLNNGDIGRKLTLAEDTIKTYNRRIFRKLGARSRAQAVAIGIRRGLIK